MPGVACCRSPCDNLAVSLLLLFPTLLLHLSPPPHSLQPLPRTLLHLLPGREWISGAASVAAAAVVEAAVAISSGFTAGLFARFAALRYPSGSNSGLRRLGAIFLISKCARLYSICSTTQWTEVRALSAPSPSFCRWLRGLPSRTRTAVRVRPAG